MPNEQEITEAVERLTRLAAICDTGGPSGEVVMEAYGPGGRIPLGNDLRTLLAALPAPSTVETREKVARIIDPDAWEPFSTDPIFLLAEDRRRSLVKADEILAALPTPADRGRVQVLEEALAVALGHARRMKNAPKHVGPRETAHDARLHRFWGRTVYNEGKQLWDALKPYRVLPAPPTNTGEAS